MLLKNALHLFRRRVDGVASRWLLKGHAKHVVTGFGDDFFVVVFDLFFPLRRHIFLHGGQYEIRCSLEYRHLRCSLGDLWQHLYRGGAGADDANALARHVEAFWPSRGVEDRTIKAVLPSDVG